MTRLPSSGKVQCQGCKELPAYSRVCSDADGNRIDGERCNNCGTVRIVKRRAAPKRDAANARLAATLAWLDECGA